MLSYAGVTDEPDVFGVRLTAMLDGDGVTVPEPEAAPRVSRRAGIELAEECGE